MALGIKSLRNKSIYVKFFENIFISSSHNYFMKLWMNSHFFNHLNSSSHSILSLLS